MTTNLLDVKTVETFAAEGVVVLRGLFADWVETLRAGVTDNMDNPGPWAKFYTPEGQPGHFFGDYCNWQRIAAYERFVKTSTLGQVSGELMQCDTVRFFHEHVLVKEPGTEERTPWHHDQPYYSVDGKQNASLWIPLDPVPQATCPEFIPKSHRWGKWYRPTRFTGQEWDREQEKEPVETIPDIESERERYEIVSWALEPGDAIAFNFLTVHGAPPNLSGTHRRRGFSARVVGDDATWAVRSGPTSPPFPELQNRLNAGDSLAEVKTFPVIFENH